MTGAIIARLLKGAFRSLLLCVISLNTFLKYALNRLECAKAFAAGLCDNLRMTCKAIAPGIRVQWQWDYLSIDTPDLQLAQQQALLEVLRHTSGISQFAEVVSYAFQSLDDIANKACELYAAQLVDKTFVVRCKRKGEHSFSSGDAERHIGSALLQHSAARGVKMKNPDMRIDIEIKEQLAYLVRQRYVGAGGYPAGSLDAVLSLISGGYDSSVASYMAMRRGLSTHFCFFNLGGHAHETGVKALAFYLWSHYGLNSGVYFYSVPFSNVVAELLSNVKDAYMGVILKRMMLRVATQIAQRHDLKALVTGESVAQVSSQTLSNLAAIDQVTNALILRPLITMDKPAIIAQAQALGTAVFAENIPEYCGVASVKPTTRARMSRIEQEEAGFDFGVLEQALAATKREKITELSLASTAQVEEFAYPLGDSVIIDIRHPEDCQRKPLVVAQANKIIELPFYKLDVDFMHLDSRRTYCLYCDRGVMSRMHAALLYEKGIPMSLSIDLKRAFKCSFYGVLFSFFFVPRAAADLPSAQTLASINLCPDQLLLELLPGKRIESLSFLATDRQYSPNWRRAQHFKLNHAKVEELFLLKSSHVLVSTLTPVLLHQVLVQLNKQLIVVPNPATLADLKQLLKTLGMRIGAEQRAQRLIAQLQYIERKKIPEKKRTVLLLGAGGFSVGGKTLDNYLFTKAGFENVAAMAGVDYFSTLSLEKIIMLQPDIILISDSTTDKSSAAQRFLKHPALLKALPHSRILNIEGAFSVCSPHSIVRRFKLLEAIYARHAI